MPKVIQTKMPETEEDLLKRLAEKLKNAKQPPEQPKR
jgi:hypothetical protein